MAQPQTEAQWQDLFNQMQRYPEAFTDAFILRAASDYRTWRSREEARTFGSPLQDRTEKAVTQSDDVTRLIKLMKMTTSSHDGEALVAMRKANDELRRLGWDWDTILTGKIKIVENPFVNMRRPPDSVMGTRNGSVPQKPKQPAYDPFSFDNGNVRGATPPPQQPPQWRPLALPVNSSHTTAYDGNCYCCGNWMLKGDGRLFNPSHWNQAAQNKRVPICSACNSNPTLVVPPCSARRKSPPRTTSINDL